jgi:fumarate hydratase subunit alpha
VRLDGGDFNEAINQGVREAYEEGYLRKSVVDDPLFDRTNTKDNTPAIVYLEMVPGDKIHIEVTAKGGGSENMSAMKVLTPSQGEQGVRDFVVSAIEKCRTQSLPSAYKLGIGPGGFGGRVTALAVNIEYFPAHIASLPVVVNTCCHAARHDKAVI